MSDFLPHPFWNFSLELYAGEGVAPLLQALNMRTATAAVATARTD